MKLSLHWMIFTLVMMVSSCGQVGAGGVTSSPGDCAVNENETINTYVFVAKWKKITGYGGATPNPSNDTLNLSYDILYVEPGTRACGGNVVSGGYMGVNWRADYVHDIEKKKIVFTYANAGSTDPARVNNWAYAKYSFSGSCGDTEMTLRYYANETSTTPSATETYKLINQQVEPGACDASSSN